MYEKERITPGSTAKAFAFQSMYQNRYRLKLRRLKYMKDHDFPKRKLDMCATKAMSSDERTADGTFAVHDMPFRSDEMHIMFEGVDKGIQEENALTGKRDQFRVRKRKIDSKVSPYKSQPLGIGIQYYKVELFNKLPRFIKHKLAKYQVTFPSDTLQHASPHDSDKLSNEEFESTYGPALEVYDYYASDADDQEAEMEENDSLLAPEDYDMAERDVEIPDSSDEGGVQMEV